ncbi:PPE family protein, partial [Mycobacterium marinum]|uniref:PPE family protein n=1 Tax=Mycobacterium marinum TaxID=1781 RepID=UPI00356AC56F
MNFSIFPPEINSLRMFTGAGSAPMLQAAAAWEGLAGELGSAADSFASVTSGLVGQAWQGPASAAMAANRNALVQMVMSNIFGQNAPAIAAAEAAYEEMWAQDVAAMFGYHSGASAVAAALSPWEQLLQNVPALSPLAAIGNLGAGNLGFGNTGIANLGNGNTGNLNFGGG